jgi:CHAT domain-containing protein
VRTGADASEGALRRDVGSADILHLAGFGVLNRRNPLFSYVQLASDSLDDGRLEVHEVYGLAVRGLVVLSACETALATGAGSDVPPGDDWVGLVQAFLAAGASAVAATHWRIDDRATAALMRGFYARLHTGAGPAQALAEAQRAALHDPSTGHPFFWAGFSLSGVSSR